nr:VOC family protein [Ciceribacter sp. L1K23]
MPVRDLDASAAFYEAIGAMRNPQFSDDSAKSYMFSETIAVMLLTHARYGEFTSRPIGDARAESQALLAISVDSREAVDATLNAGADAGGTADPNPPQDHGFMYSRSIEDPDGYVWELVWMDPAAVAGDMSLQ